MAFKFISIADLLQTRGNGGVRGNAGGPANVHAGVVAPLKTKRAPPPPAASGDQGESLKGRGGTEPQRPCGFHATAPSDPTDPACFEGTPRPSPSDDIGPPINTDTRFDAWHVLDLAQGGSDFKTATNSDEFYPWLEVVPDDIPTHALTGGHIEPPVVQADPMAWQALAAAYHAHHFCCPTCIAAGRGLEYGERCVQGLLLWTAYEDPFIADGECATPLFSSNPLPVQECHDK